MIYVENLDSYKPGTYPLHEDLFNMGQKMAENVYILFGAHDTEKSSYLVVVNTETGERVKLWFGPGHNGVWNSYHIKHVFEKRGVVSRLREFLTKWWLFKKD